MSFFTDATAQIRKLVTSRPIWEMLGKAPCGYGDLPLAILRHPINATLIPKRVTPLEEAYARPS